MLKRLLLVLASLTLSPCAQQNNLRLVGSTPTQILIEYKPSSSAACTVEASELRDFSVLVNDVNTSLFSGASTDANRKVESSNGVRRVIIGKRKAEIDLNGKGTSRALAADTTHYIRVTCDGNTSGILTTTTARIAGNVPDALPFDPAFHGNWAMPEFEYGMANKSKSIIDPLTGTRYKRLTDPAENGYQRILAFSTQISSGWTNAANALSDSVSTRATVSSTNPMFLAFDGTQDYGLIGGYAAYWYSGSNVDVRINGFSPSATIADRKVNVCLTLDSGQTCWGNTLQVTLPQSSDTATSQWVNASFPTAGFAGWDKAIPRNMWPNGDSESKLSVSGHNVTVQANYYGNRKFMYDWAPGSRILIPGSSPTCPSNLCTVDKVTGNLSMTIVESVNLTNVPWYSKHAGVKIWKDNGTSSAQLSAGYQVVGQYEMQSSGEEQCSANTVIAHVDAAGMASADTPGRLCKFRDYGMGQAERLYFVADATGEARLLSLFRVPSSISGHSSGDLPNDAGYSKTAISVFDDSDGNVMWTAYNTPNGKAIFKLTYSGDYRALGSYKWGYGGNISSDDNQVTWLNTTKGGPSLSSQAAAWSGFDASYWGAPALDFRAVVQGKAIFIHQPLGQDYAAWIFSYDLVSSTLEHAFNTFNTYPFLSFGGLHSISGADLVALPIHTQDKANADKSMSGPFQALVTHVKKSGSWSTNTSLSSTYTGNSVDAACPTDIDQKYKDRGAVGNNCVQIRLQNEPCSSNATAAEKAKYPCPADSNKSWLGTPLTVGHVLWDKANYDGESMMIVKVTGTLEYTLLRDQYNGYKCYISNPRQRTYFTGGTACTGTSEQTAHNDGWSVTGMPSSNDFYWNPVTNEFYENSGALGRGHYDITAIKNGDGSFSHTAIGAATGPGYYYASVNKPASDYGNSQTPSWVNFGGNFSNLGMSDISAWMQSYAKAPASNPTDSWWKRIATDWKHLNPSLGATPEAQGQGIGNSRTVELISGTTNVYKVGFTGAWSKKRPLWVWAADKVLGEKSGPTTGDTLTDSDTWKFCYALNATECRHDSSAGDLYAVIPNANTTEAYCNSSQAINRIPCAWSSAGSTSRIVQFRIDQNDTAGISSRSIGLGLAKPSQAYVYSAARSYPAGQKVLLTGQSLSGWFTGPIIADPGRWPTAGTNAEDYIPVKVEVASGKKVVVKFGYDSNFYCTARAEACTVKAATIGSDPFNYAGASGAMTGTTNVVRIPALPGRVLYFQVLVDGVAGDVQVMAVN